jgi:hypothetical protein
VIFEHQSKGEIADMEKLLTVEDAKTRLFAGLADITGWKLQKSRSQLNAQTNDLVFQLDVHFSKYNRSEESICADLDFCFWNRGYGKTGDVNSIVGNLSYRNGENSWFDISTEEKLGSVLRQLEPQLRDTAVNLFTRFETDYDAAMKKLVDEDLIKYRIWLRFIEDKLGREAVEQAARTLCEQAAEPMKRQLTEFAATGKIGGWLRMDRNAKYMAEHGLIRLP